MISQLIYRSILNIYIWMVFGNDLNEKSEF